MGRYSRNFLQGTCHQNFDIKQRFLKADMEKHLLFSNHVEKFFWQQKKLSQVAEMVGYSHNILQKMKQYQVEQIFFYTRFEM